MLPPVLEIYVIWHPADHKKGSKVADAIIDHYHGDTFSGLIGGAVEVYTRSVGWTGPGSTPRPIALPNAAGIPAPPAFVAIVPLLGNGLARALAEDPSDPWHDYLRQLKQAETQLPEKVSLGVGVLDGHAPSSPALSPLFADRQFLAAKDPLNWPDDTMFCRDLSQTLVQFLDKHTEQIKVFVSHTKRLDMKPEKDTAAFIKSVRQVIGETRLGEFFDSNTIQPGEKWATVLREHAGRDAMLSLRTDLYAGREWCQREVSIAKTKGMPVVVMDALERGDRRGSFLLDHVPRLPARRTEAGWDHESIQQALGLLVDECLKRALWRHQEILAAGTTDVTWWAPHAPEPLTLSTWLKENPPSDDGPVLILHPDPPLTPCERETIDSLAALAKLEGRLEVLTPRTYAARGGGSTSRAGGT